MYKLAIILLGVFATSMADVCQNVTYTQSKAFAELDNVVTDLETKYNKVHADFMKCNETAAAEVARLHKKYDAEIKAEFQRGENVLIIPYVPVFPACTIIYMPLLPYQVPLERIVRVCVSKWHDRNTYYLQALERNRVNYKQDVNLNKLWISDLVNNTLANDDRSLQPATDRCQYVIDSIKTDAQSIINNLKQDIDEDIVAPDWATKDKVEKEIDECLKYHHFYKLRQDVSDIIENTDKCVTQNRKIFFKRRLKKNL